MIRELDYDMHGQVALRLVSPTPAIRAEAARQFDPLRPVRLDRSPDVILDAAKPSRHADDAYLMGDAGDSLHSSFDENGFWVSAGRGSVSIPFPDIGGPAPWRIGCRGSVAVRGLFINYLRPVLQLALFSRGIGIAHSAAAVVNGQAVLFAGWSESGKTEAAIACMRHDAQLLSDKWTVVSKEGQAYHFPTPMTIRGWMLDYLPGLRQNLPPLHVYRARLATTIETALRRAPAVPTGLRLAALMRPLLSLGTRISVTPSLLLRDRGAMRYSAPLSRLFLLLTRPGPIRVRPASLADVIPRLVDSTLYEWRLFLNVYRRFSYACPGSANPLIDGLREVHARVLEDTLATCQTFIVEAPFPFEPESLYTAVRPFLPG